MIFVCRDEFCQRGATDGADGSEEIVPARGMPIEGLQRISRLPAPPFPPTDAVPLRNSRSPREDEAEGRRVFIDDPRRMR
jgi:hypothetical protein